MKILVFIALLLLQNAGAFSQDSASVTTKYEQQTIYLYGSKYRLNNQVINQNKIGAYLLHSPEASPDFGLYKKFRRKAGLFVLLGLGTYVAGLTQIDSNNNLAFGLMGAGTLLNFTTTFPLTIKATKHLQKSVWLYNKTVLQ